jgi:hypothetical protein
MTAAQSESAKSVVGQNGLGKEHRDETPAAAS